MIWQRDMERSLPFIPTAQPQEAPLSLLRRAALENGYHRLLSLLHSLVPDIDYSNGMLGYVARNPALYRYICNLIGIDKSCSERTTYKRAGAARKDSVIWMDMTVAIGDLDLKDHKICIPCYLKKGYTLAEWDHIAACGCNKHDVLLDSACPVCGELFTYDNTPLACGCDHSEVLAKLQPLAHSSASILASIINQKDQSRLQLLTQICRLIDWWNTHGLEVTPLDRAIFAEQLSLGLWPINYQSNQLYELHPSIVLYPLIPYQDDALKEVLVRLLLSAPKTFPMSITKIKVKSGTALTMLGISETRLKQFNIEGLISSPSEEGYALEQINDLLIRSKWLPFNTQKAQEVRPMMSGRNPMSLARVIKNELAPHTDGLLYNQPSGLQINSSKKNEEEQCWFTVSEAADLLGANTESVRYLIKSGLIEATKGTPTSAVQWRIHKPFLTKFRQKYVFASEIARKIGLPVTTTSSRIRANGISPISGPRIDAGRTYLFLRGELAKPNLCQFLSGDYHSPAGRKVKTIDEVQEGTLSSKKLASLLDLTIHEIRKIVSSGWIEGTKNSQGQYVFELTDALKLTETLQSEYIKLETAAKNLEQSIQSFRRTWLISGYVDGYRFANRTLLRMADYLKIQSIWNDQATSTHIARSLGRQRTFCINLEKIGLLQPTLVFGEGAKSIKLFPREHPVYQCYRI